MKNWKKKRGAGEEARILDWVKLPPVPIVKPRRCPCSRSCFLHVHRLERAPPPDPGSWSNRTFSITARGGSAHASEFTIKYLSQSSSDFDRVLMLLTALACCCTYWSKHGRSNIVVLLKVCKNCRTQSVQFSLLKHYCMACRIHDVHLDKSSKK